MPRALLLQLDGKIPNIALMRLSAHLKERGTDVEFRRHVGNVSSLERGLFDNFDAVYASLIFERTRPLAEHLLKVRPDAVVGGTGWNYATTLESIGVATTKQDYGIYPGFKPSILFTQRGCRNGEAQCPFCCVPKKEGRIVAVQTIAEGWRGEPHPRELILLDNDFFGQKNWRERIAEIRDGGFKVSFNQGINARFLNDASAAAIGSVDYRDDQMRDKRIYTAWDSRPDEERLFRGLELLVKYGVKPRHIMVYMLVGYWAGESHEDRDYRRRRLRDFGALPYPMPFVRTPDIVGFQRWVIGGYDNGKDAISWPEWKAAKCQPRRLRRREERNLRLPVIG